MRQMYLKTEEICKAIRQGNDVTENIAQIEPQLKHYYKERRKALQESSFNCANDSILHAWDALYDVSASVRKHWDTVYPILEKPEGRYGAVLRFINTREIFGYSPYGKCPYLKKDWLDISGYHGSLFMESF